VESLRFDFNPHKKDLISVYLELRKWVAKKKVIFSCLNPRHNQENLWCSFSLRASVCSSTLIFTCLDIGQVNLGEALRQLYEDDIFPSRKALIKYALDSYPDTSLIKYNVGSSMSQIMFSWLHQLIN
jgi:hypothetical protein